MNGRLLGFVALIVTSLCVVGGLRLWHSSKVTVWRIHRKLLRSGLPAQILVFLDGHNVVLRGSVHSRGDYVLASVQASTVVGVGKVVNELRIEGKEQARDPNQRIGMIDIAVDTYYDDSPTSLQQISAILKLPQFEQISAVTGSTISGIIFDRYGFGSSDLPQSYRLLEQALVNLNNLDSPQNLHPGLLKVPILPRRTPAFVHAPTAPSGHAQPGFTWYGIAGVASYNGTAGQNVLPILTEPPKSSTNFILQVPVTRATAEQTREVAGLPFTITSNKMSITFAATQQPSGFHTTLGSEDRTAIVNGLKIPIRRKPTVFILDSGWPDAANYSSSLGELRRLVDVATNYYQLPKRVWADDPFVPPALDEGSQHCVQIRDSLREFTDLDSAHAIRVVYVPLSQAQNSTPILKELLSLYYIRKLVGDGRQVDGSILKTSEDFADLALNTNTFQKISSKTIDTEGAIVEAVWSLADLAAQSDPQRSIFLINESWTVDPSMREDAHSGISAGIAIAAVGNTPGQVVNADIGRVDFAGQCATTKSVIAVLDVKPNATLFCGSSQLQDTLLDDSFAVGFDGEVVDGGLCGSSFSAPRFAWILALEEAIRSQTLQRSEWVIYLQHKLAATRRQSPDVWQHLYVHPVDLLKSP